MADKPIVLVELQINQFGITETREVERERFRLAVSDLEQATGVFAGIARAVAFAGVGPVGGIDATIRSETQGDSHKPRILRFHQV